MKRAEREGNKAQAAQALQFFLPIMPGPEVALEKYSNANTGNHLQPT